MSDPQQNRNPDTCPVRGLPSPTVSQSIEWYSEGQERIVEVGGTEMRVRLVGRNGRRARISITAPPGAVFRARERDTSVRFPDRSP
jgi:hypothetical protein